LADRVDIEIREMKAIKVDMVAIKVMVEIVVEVIVETRDMVARAIKVDMVDMVEEWEIRVDMEDKEIMVDLVRAWVDMVTRDRKVHKVMEDKVDMVVVSVRAVIKNGAVPREDHHQEEVAVHHLVALREVVLLQDVPVAIVLNPHLDVPVLPLLVASLVHPAAARVVPAVLHPAVETVKVKADLPVKENRIMNKIKNRA
jgi:hypothetical protein